MSIHVVYFMVGINADTGNKLRNCCLSAVHSGKASELVVHISSVGGGLHEAFTLYHFLKSLPVKVTTTNAGSVESSAVIMYLGGHHRIASSTGRFVFHPWTWDFGAGGQHIPVIEEALHSLKADMERFVEVFTQGTAGAKQPFDVRPSFTAAQAVDAKGALAHGIAHEIKEPVTPPGAVTWWVG